MKEAGAPTPITEAKQMALPETAHIGGEKQEQQTPVQNTLTVQAEPQIQKPPESPTAALVKATIEAVADFVVAATTPYGAPNPEPVKIFNRDEPKDLTIPQAAREAYRQQVAEQMLGKRETKAEKPLQRKTGEPEKLAAKERRLERDSLQRLVQVRSQIARLPNPSSLPIAA